MLPFKNEVEEPTVFHFYTFPSHTMKQVFYWQATSIQIDRKYEIFAQSLKMNRARSPITTTNLQKHSRDVQE
jgi:hypothetical protein